MPYITLASVWYSGCLTLPTFLAGVIARHPSYVPFIRAALTEESVEKYFKHLFPTPPEEGRCRVKRYTRLFVLFYQYDITVKDNVLLRPVSYYVRLQQAETEYNCTSWLICLTDGRQITESH